MLCDRPRQIKLGWQCRRYFLKNFTCERISSSIGNYDASKLTRGLIAVLSINVTFSIIDTDSNYSPDGILILAVA